MKRYRRRKPTKGQTRSMPAISVSAETHAAIAAWAKEHGCTLGDALEFMVGRIG